MGSWLEKVLDAEIEGVVTILTGRKVLAPLLDGGEIEGGGKDFDGVPAFG